MRYFIIIALLNCCTALAAQPDKPLRVQRLHHGFTISKELEGREVLLAYSETGDFDRAMQIDTLFRKVIETFDKQTKLRGPRLNAAPELPDAVAPLCTDAWTQDDPYNNLSPIIDSTHCKTGCVATAMSEVMYYYKHPARGTGSHTYSDVKGCKETLTADFSTHTYEWDYMLDSYAGVNYSARQAQAVALLASDCGISVEMQYGVEASGAESVRQPYALFNYFGYDPGMRMVYRDFYHRSELHAMIRNELAASRPVLCSAHDSGGGHAFVIDGYDNQGLYHINWGWGGWCNGYYNIDYMNPDQPEWNHDPNRREKGMNYFQSFTLGIQPYQAGTPSVETHEYAFSHLELKPDSALIVHHLSNIGWNQHQGKVVLGLTGTESEEMVKVVYDYNRLFELEEFEDTTYTDTILLTSILPQLSGLKDATYRLMPMFEDNGVWKRARTICGTPYFIYIAKRGDEIQPREAQSALEHLELVSMQLPDTVTRGTYAPCTIEVANNSDDEYCGRIFITHESDLTPSGYQMLASVGLYIEPHTTETIDFKYMYISNRLSDTIRVHVLYDIDLFTDSLIVFDQTKEITVVNQASGISPATMATRTKRLFDPTGKPLNQLLPHQIIISDDGKKRSIQNVP